MDKQDGLRLTQAQIQAAEGILNKGDRVELIPVKDGVRVMRIRRTDMLKTGKKG